jgi:O-antigen/teichoic acid export membrane protein
MPTTERDNPRRPNSVTSQVATGVTWMVLQRIVGQLIGLSSTLILVRLLEPADFGIVAMAYSIIAILQLMTTFGFDIVLIQDQSADRRKYDTAWTFNALFGLGIAVAVLVAAVPAAGFYEEPRLVEVFAILAATSLLQGLQNIGLVDFRKHLQFQKEFTFGITEKLVGFVVTIALAFALRSYYALVYGALISAVAALGLSYWMHPFRPRLSLVAAAEIFTFSRWLFLNNLAYFVRFRGIDLIVGKLAGATGLGLFSISYQIANLPTSDFVSSINRALMPGLARISAEPERVRSGFVRAAAVIALISLPAGFGIAVTADPLVRVVLGSKWIAAIPLVAILAIFGALISTASPAGSALVAVGRPKIPALLGLANAVVLIPTLILLTSSSGPQGAAWALVIATAGFLPFTYGITAKYLGLSVGDIKQIFLRPAAATGLMYLAVWYLLGQFEATAETLVVAAHLALAVMVGACSYVAGVLALWAMAGRPEGAETFAIEWLREKYSKLSALATNRRV